MVELRASKLITRVRFPSPAPLSNTDERSATAAQTEPQAFMRSVLQRIATGPEYSKDLPQEEARAALNLILNGQADPVQAGIFFIALRMKRETLEENTGVLEALHDHTVPEVADVVQVVDVAEPYDGFVRGAADGGIPAGRTECLRGAVDLPWRRDGRTEIWGDAATNPACLRGGCGPSDPGSCRTGGGGRMRLELRGSVAVLSRPAPIAGIPHPHRQAPGADDGGGAARTGARPRGNPPRHRLRAQALPAGLRAPGPRGGIRIPR